MDNGDYETRSRAGFALAGTYYRETSHAFSEAWREGGDESAILLKRSPRGSSLRTLSHNRNTERSHVDICDGSTRSYGHPGGCGTTMSDDKAESNSYHPLAWLGWEQKT